MSRTLRILYVDDDRDIRTIVAMALSLDPGLDVRTVESGQAALDLLAQSVWRPDVAVLDMMMPDLDGIETLRRVRRLPGLERVTALFMTAKGREAELLEYREQGADGVILKPFDPVALAGTIRTLAGGAGGSRIA